ncbi:MAG: hypothetical protein CM1200mP39_15730 [Dehalococcoidia bacterium]|nr:MAG: hypothetical protein CM1200mP39_15730 [Dehalococcoidia bacterium]
MQSGNYAPRPPEDRDATRATDPIELLVQVGDLGEHLRPRLLMMALCADSVVVPTWIVQRLCDTSHIPFESNFTQLRWV